MSFSLPSDSDPEGTLEKRVREDDCEAEAETGTGVWERLALWRCTTGSGSSESSTKRERPEIAEVNSRDRVARKGWITLLTVVLDNGRELGKWELGKWELGRHDSRGGQIGTRHTCPAERCPEPFGCLEG